MEIAQKCTISKPNTEAPPLNLNITGAKANRHKPYKWGVYVSISYLIKYFNRKLFISCDIDNIVTSSSPV